MNTNVITSDRQIKPNFVPETKNKDYIEQDDTFGSLIEKNRKLVNEDYPDAIRITLVIHNLNTHVGASLYKV